MGKLNLAKDITRYDLLISCPGDIDSEIEIIQNCVDDFNEMFSDETGIMLQARHWRKSSFAQSGGKPQNILNDQFIKNCDAAVAILWTRFGTPTDEYLSGTEEEIEIMLQSGKQVFMYFSNKPIPPSELDDEQHSRVKDYRKRYSDLGLYFGYSSDEEFEKMFFAHLTKYFMVKKESDDNLNQVIPKLKLRGIDYLGNISDDAYVQTLRLNSDFTSEKVMKKAKALFKDISKIKTEKTIENLFLPPHIYQDPIIRFAEDNNFEIDDNFFNLGNLQTNKDTFSLSGSEREKEKYDLHRKLGFLIDKAYKWFPIEENFKSLQCIKLAIENEGTTFDEDIEVSLFLEKTDFVEIGEDFYVKDDMAAYLVSNANLVELLAISSAPQYLDYYSTKSETTNMSDFQDDDSFEKIIPVSEKIRGEDYQTKFKDIFLKALGYVAFETEHHIQIKLKIEYLKHHSIVAFPAPVFLKRVPTKILYAITSKHRPDKVEGVINVKSEL